MSGRRICVKDRLGHRGGESFKVLLRKSNSEERMEEGELFENNRDGDWYDPKTRVMVVGMDGRKWWRQKS